MADLSKNEVALIMTVVTLITGKDVDPNAVDTTYEDALTRIEALRDQ